MNYIYCFSEAGLLTGPFLLLFFVNHQNVINSDIICSPQQTNDAALNESQNCHSDADTLALIMWWQDADLKLIELFIYVCLFCPERRSDFIYNIHLILFDLVESTSLMLYWEGVQSISTYELRKDRVEAATILTIVCATVFSLRNFILSIIWVVQRTQTCLCLRSCLERHFAANERKHQPISGMEMDIQSNTETYDGHLIWAYRFGFFPSVTLICLSFGGILTKELCVVLMFLYWFCVAALL